MGGGRNAGASGAPGSYLAPILQTPCGVGSIPILLMMKPKPRDCPLLKVTQPGTQFGFSMIFPFPVDFISVPQIYIFDQLACRELEEFH